MTQPYQGKLFDDSSQTEPSIDAASLAAATDYRLDEHSWITYVPGLLRGDLTLLQQLSVVAHWEQRQRWMFNRMVDEPRLTGEYRDLSTAPRLLAELGTTLSDYCGVPYDGIWINWYRDNRDGTGWHADRPAHLVPTATVPVLSLGATRRFLIRPTGGGRSVVFTPTGGDLMVMRGRCQRDWQHCVPKQKRSAGARMSLNFTSTSQGSSMRPTTAPR